MDWNRNVNIQYVQLFTSGRGTCCTITITTWSVFTFLTLFPFLLPASPPPLHVSHRSLMRTVSPGTPSVRTCCAFRAMATSTSRLATSLYTSRRCKALWLATMAQRSSAFMFIPWLPWRCLRCVVIQHWCREKCCMWSWCLKEGKPLLRGCLFLV